MSLTLSTYLDTAARRAGFDPEALYQFASGWPHLLARLVPFLLELIACALLYCVIPNCAVRWRDGLAGAAGAAVAVRNLQIRLWVFIRATLSYPQASSAPWGHPV